MRTVQMRKNISDGCQRALKIGKENNLYIGVRAPYGYILDKQTKKLIIDKKVSFIIYLIFDLYDKGLGLTTIAEYLNDRFIAPPTIYRKTGEYIISQQSYLKWEKSAIRKIINNKVYNGKYIYSEEITHSKIINDSLWKRVCSRQLEKRNRGGHDNFDHNGNEFGNIAYCSCCHKPLTIEKSRCRDGLVSYLRCSSYDKRGNHKYKCENKLAIRYSELSDIVNMFIKKEVFSKLNLNDIQNDYYDRIKNTNKEEFVIHRDYLKQEKIELLRLKDRYQNLVIEHDNTLINKVMIENKEKMLINIDNRLKEVEELLKESYSFMRTTTILDKDIYLDRYMLDSFISKIYVGILTQNKRDITIELK